MKINLEKRKEEKNINNTNQFKKVFTKIYLSGTIAISCSLYAQTCNNVDILTNGAMEGNVGSSIVPTSWYNIPLNYKNVTTATHSNGVTSDTVNETHTVSNVAAYPAEGNTAVSSIKGGAFGEGLMQSFASGPLLIGKTYTITLQQAVKIQNTGFSSNSGYWKVYLSTVDRTTAPETSNLFLLQTSPTTITPHTNYTDKNLVWETRTITFIADKAYKTIYFMAETNTSSGVRMFLDDVKMTTEVCTEAPAHCHRPANTSGVGLDTNHGITLLNRAGDNGDSNHNNDWPMLRKGAWTALESNTKGLVFTRMTTAQINAISNPQEGMISYDTDEKCLKIYNGTKWSCFSTPSCPN